MADIPQIIATDLLFLFKGMLVGVAVSAPIGPASIMCIRRTIHNGWWLGVASGLGVALADTLYGSIAGIGLTSIATAIVTWLSKLRFVGGGFLIILGITLFLTSPKKEPKHYYVHSFVPAVFSTFGITLANPLVFILIAAVFAAMGLEDLSQDPELVGCVILGIFLGSMSWWTSFCGVLTLLQNHINVTTLTWTNKVSGLGIVIFGILAMLR